MQNRYWKRLIFIIMLAPVFLFCLMVSFIYWKQDAIVQEFIATANKDFKGTLEIKDSHISPFANFPYISIDLDHLKVFEDRSKAGDPLIDISDVYLGFDLLTLVQGQIEIKALKLKDGSMKLVQHPDGNYNIANALSGRENIEDPAEEFHLDIQSIQLVNIDLVKINEKNDILIEAFIDEARSHFKSSKDHVLVSLDSRFQMNVVMGGDTTFIKHKHVEVNTRLDYANASQVLTIQPSELKLEKAIFNMEGTVDLDDDMNLNIKFHGSKPNFDLFLAFAPEELAPALERYDNAGKIFFEASVTGKSINGYNPLVVADFGCEDAFFNNRISKKKLDQLFFKGHFTTGDRGNASTMEFSINDFSARPEAGIFSGNLFVKNFESPEIEMQVRSEFQLDFLAQFLEIQDLQDLKGSVALTMNFHDIIDLTQPEKSIEKLNESYYTELEVKDLSFRTSSYHLPIHNIDIKATMDGHEAIIDHFAVKVGDSDLSFRATVSDLPAILHHTRSPVTASLDIQSSLLDIKELTSHDTLKSKAINEKITNLKMKLKFNSSARAFTESPNLPVGEFFIEDLFAKLNNYPHSLHDFHADVFVDSADFRVVDFTGIIDKSDFHFNGKLKNYDLWFLNEPIGETKVEFNLTSDLLQLHDVFSYGGENYVPEDYRHEEFEKLKVHGYADLHFNKGLESADIDLDKVEALMKVHPLRFENFKGRVHFDDDHLMIQGLQGKLGKSEFAVNMNYYLGPDSIIRKRDNHFSLSASRLDFDELFNYNPPPVNKTSSPEDHEAVFNIYDLPFSDMTFDFDIKHLNYHRYMIDDFFVKARTTKNHYIYIDTMSLAAAGGKIRFNGYFDGSDRNKIYLSTDMSVENVDLDKLLFKFENFGQDHLVSENLHGKLSGRVTGKVHMHADLVPIIDDSEIHLDLQVVQGRLEHYNAFDAMSDFFKNKNLDLVRFDTLKNRFDLNKGVLSVPAMTINSTLGFIEISGRQDLEMNMEYYVRVPFKLVTEVAAQKLFGNREEKQNDEDEIQYRDKSRRQRFINLKISGTPDTYKITLAKDKSDSK
jgi:hypothetical protein